MLFLALACIDATSYRAPPDDAVSSDATSPAVAPTNLIVIGFDTLRADRIGAYGGGDLTPNLDAVLSESLLLDDHRSCSNWTFGALTCLWAGAYGEDIGFVPQGSYAQPSPAPEDLTTVPRWLRKKRDFTTALVGASPWFGDDWNLTEGFGVRLTQSNADAEEVIGWVGDIAPTLGQEGNAWMLQVHLIDPHMPFDAPREYWDGVDLEMAEDYSLATTEGINEAIDDYDRLGPVDQERLLQYFDDIYDAEVRWTDERFGELWDTLDDAGVLDDAVVVFWSDHGEQFYEHGDWAHGKTLHAEETRALGALWAPGLAAQTWTEPTSVIDLLPTALDWMDKEAPSFVTGVPAGEASPKRPRYLVQGADDRTLQGVDVENLRLIYSWEDGMSLFDIDEDPEELNDLWKPNEDGYSAIVELLEAQGAKLEPLMR